MNIKNCYCCLLGLCFWTVMDLAAQNQKPFVIPEIKEWKGGEGEFVPSSTPVVGIETSREDLSSEKLSAVIRNSLLPAF